MAAKPSFDTAEAGAYLNRGGASWLFDLGEPLTISYAYRGNGGGGDEAATFTKFTNTQITIAELAILSWADVANITFERQGSGTYNNNAAILFGNFSEPEGAGAAHAYQPSPGSFAYNPASPAGDVWVNVAYDYEANPVFWEYGMLTMTHELGHALGLDHPGDYNAGEGGPITYANSAEYREDTRQYTVMSYFSESNTGADFNGYFSPAPLLHDIAAMQRLYGANTTVRTGDDTYGFNSNTDRLWYSAETSDDPLIFCVWDNGGNDTLDFSGYDMKQQIFLKAEKFSNVGGMKGNISIYADVVVENAIGGSSADQITGNDADNVLEGRTGLDQLIGGKGADTLIGGANKDRLTGGDDADVFVWQSASDSVKNLKKCDVIFDLERGDSIDLSAIDANNNQGGDQAFTLVGDAFSGARGELIVFYKAKFDATFVQGDANGDGVADWTIRIRGDHTDFNDFVL